MSTFITKYKIPGLVYEKSLTDGYEPTQFLQLTKIIKVYKKIVKRRGGGRKEFLVEMSIPTGAIIHIPRKWEKFGRRHDRKCRAEYAVINSIKEIDNSGWRSPKEGKEVEGVIRSGHNSFKKVAYEKDTIVAPQNGFSTRKRVCDPGIHFFFDKEDALNY